MRSDPTLSGAWLAAATEMIRRRTGLIFPESRHSALQDALARTVRRSGAEPEAWLTGLDGGPVPLDDLVAEITIGETYFFRDPQQFQVIGQEVLPSLVERARSGRRPRIWSAGCATGEEPYTLAIILAESGLAEAAHVVATDISRASLARAVRASYTRWSLRGVPESRVQACFERRGAEFHLLPALRDAVDFRYLNLAEDTFPSIPTGIWGMDLILCRNVLIYLDAETIARVARRLIDSLSEDGWLLLGASDPALGSLVPCEVVVTSAGLAYRRPRPGARVAAPSGGETSFVVPPAAVADPVPRPAPPALQPAAPVLSPVRSEDQAIEAARCYAQRAYERAAALAEGVVRRDPGDAATWVVWVRSEANRGDLKAAGRACAAALERHPVLAELAYLDAVLLGEAGLHLDAARAARRALYLDGSLIVAHLALGGALARLRQRDGARRSFRNAARLLADLPPAATVPASDGEPAGRLLEMARAQLQLLPAP